MGVGFDEDFWRGSVADEGAVDVVHETAFGGAGVEFSVGKGACAAFAKAVVRILNHGAMAQDWGEIEATGGGVFSSFEDDGFETFLQAGEGGEEPSGASADDDDFFGIRISAGEDDGEGSFGWEGFVDRDEDLQTVFDWDFSCVEGGFEDADASEVLGVEVKFFSSGFEVGGGVGFVFRADDDFDGF